MQHRSNTRKDRNLALTGHRLCRMHTRGMEAGHATFVTLLKDNVTCDNPLTPN